MSNDFYEDDEPIEDIREIASRPADGVTAPPMRWVSRGCSCTLSSASIIGTPEFGGFPMLPWPY